MRGRQSKDLKFVDRRPEPYGKKYGSFRRHVWVQLFMPFVKRVGYVTCELSDLRQYSRSSQTILSNFVKTFVYSFSPKPWALGPMLYFIYLFILFYRLIYINVLTEFSYSCSTTQPGHRHTDNYTTTIPYGFAICRSWDSNSGVVERLAVLPLTQLRLIHSTNSVTHWRKNATKHHALARIRTRDPLVAKPTP